MGSQVFSTTAPFPVSFASFATLGTEQRIPKGGVIYLKGQTPDYLYYLVSGAVKSVTTSFDGEEKLLAEYAAGAIFGEASFFDGQPRVSTAIALTACTVRHLNRTQVAAAIASQPELAFDLLRYLSETVRLLSDHVSQMSFLSAKQRVISYLLAGCGTDGVMQISQEQIALAVGTSRVTVNRILHELESCVETGYRCVRVRDQLALARQIAEE